VVDGLNKLESGKWKVESVGEEVSIILEELVFCYRVLNNDVLIEEVVLMASKYCQDCELLQLCHYYHN